jgi:hypothetical protein
MTDEDILEEPDAAEKYIQRINELSKIATKYSSERKKDE